MVNIVNTSNLIWLSMQMTSSIWFPKISFSGIILSSKNLKSFANTKSTAANCMCVCMCVEFFFFLPFINLFGAWINPFVISQKQNILYVPNIDWIFPCSFISFSCSFFLFSLKFFLHRKFILAFLIKHFDFPPKWISPESWPLIIIMKSRGIHNSFEKLSKSEAEIKNLLFCDNGLLCANEAKLSRAHFICRHLIALPIIYVKLECALSEW